MPGTLKDAWHLGGWIFTAAALTVGLLLGLSVYAYLPLAASGHPPINWGDPRTPERLWWLVSGQIYRPLVFGLEPHYLPGRLAAWGYDALRQLGGFWAALLALYGLWRLDRRDHAWWRLTALVALAYSLYAIGYNTADSYVYLIPTWAAATLWLGEGVGAAVAMLERLRLRLAGSSAGPEMRKGAPCPPLVARFAQGALRAAPILLLIVLPALSAIRTWPVADASRDREAQAFVEAALAGADRDAVILTATDRPTFALWYARYGLGLREDVAPVNVNLYDFPWYRDALAHAHPPLAALFDGGRWPPLEEFVGRMALERPLYRAEPLNLPLAGLSEEPQGVLVRLRGSSGR